MLLQVKKTVFEAFGESLRSFLLFEYFEKLYDICNQHTYCYRITTISNEMEIKSFSWNLEGDHRDEKFGSRENAK